MAVEVKVEDIKFADILSPQCRIPEEAQKNFDEWFQQSLAKDTLALANLRRAPVNKAIESGRMPFVVRGIKLNYDKFTTAADSFLFLVKSLAEIEIGDNKPGVISRSLFPEAGKNYETVFRFLDDAHLKSVWSYFHAFEFQGQVDCLLPIIEQMLYGNEVVVHDFKKAVDWAARFLPLELPLQPSNTSFLTFLIKAALTCPDQDTKVEIPETIQLIQEHMEQIGNHFLMVVLALFKLYGFGCEQDYAGAIELLNKAKELGEPDVSAVLCLMRTMGLGASVDFEQAWAHRTEAYAQGSHLLPLMLGMNSNFKATLDKAGKEHETAMRRLKRQAKQAKKAKK